MIVAGVDPGLSGAVAIADMRQENIGGRRGPWGFSSLLAVQDLPVKRLDEKRLLDAPRFFDLLTEYSPDLIALEWPTARPDRPVASEYRFALGNGATLAACQIACDRVTLVNPVSWKSDLGLSSDKGLSIDLARRVAPGEDAQRFFSLETKDGRAEAFLLVEYIRRKLNRGEAIVSG